MLLKEYEYLVVVPGTDAYQDYLALRHEVFCEELKRIPSSGRGAGGLAVETDAFDVHSVHVLCRSVRTGESMACSRLILPGPKGLNVSSRYEIACLGDIPHERVGEIGRLTLSPRLRRSRSSMSVAGGDGFVDDTAVGESPKAARRDGSAVACGLYREIFRQMGQYGITHCFAAMEPALARLLKRLGFPFVEAGPLKTDVQPARQPYLIGVQAARAVMAGRNASLYDFMTGADDVVQSGGAVPSEIDTVRAEPVADDYRGLPTGFR